MNLLKKIGGRFTPRRHVDRAEKLGDFTTTWQVVPITLLATVIVFSAHLSPSHY